MEVVITHVVKIAEKSAPENYIPDDVDVKTPRGNVRTFIKENGKLVRNKKNQ